ncbi:MAG: unnamed protein product [uncultured Caballeronia sp.]|nr:MAG: unnamed protein product [uncultured Caballeronia sp.]
MPAKHVIHAVGPRWSGGGKKEPELLASCYRRSLEPAEEAGCKSIAFPAISYGIYRFPPEQAVNIAVRTVIETLPSTPTVKHVIFACFKDDMLALYQAELDAAQAPPSKPA